MGSGNASGQSVQVQAIQQSSFPDFYCDWCPGAQNQQNMESTWGCECFLVQAETSYGKVFL